jgi:hypothetical protein
MAGRGKVWSIVWQVLVGLVAAGLLVLGLLVASGKAQDAGEPGVPQNSGAAVVADDAPIHDGLAQAVTAWREALRAGSPERLAAFALPEYAAHARASLNDPTSELYRVLLSEESVFRRLAVDPRTRTALFSNATPYDPERGATACLYDPAAVAGDTDADRLRMLDMAQGPTLACQTFFAVDGGWRADYEAGSGASEG